MQVFSGEVIMVIYMVYYYCLEKFFLKFYFFENIK